MYKENPSVLLHYGIPRKSGRYPWGSGEDPYQSSRSFKFLKDYTELKNSGLYSNTEIAKKMGMSTTELRNNITWARREEREYRHNAIKDMSEQGVPNTEIAKRLGISEGSVRNYLSEKKPLTHVQFDNITKAVEDGVDKFEYLDVGVGVERQLGVSRTRFNKVVDKLV